MLRENNDHAVRIVRRDVQDDSDVIGVVKGETATTKPLKDVPRPCFQRTQRY
ncbi:hypothetical protein AZE42_03051 [Rhizopogon vesiculosus]|uniref:Uncharacterized protein n=1 Tax=Rhizopogon vesiculosus TaxID=180088 RepID=A0A1J8QNF4_9AGAM|nr:hypothetical protein AZE42_03051 [Rhizopogon vesiculosus]